MVKDISFLKSGYNELIGSVRLINKDIEACKKKLHELESKKNIECRKLKIKIKEHLLDAIKDDSIKNFLSLPVYQSNEEGELINKGDVLGNLHELYVDEKEVRLGDIWGFGEYRYMYIKTDAIQALGLTPTQHGLDEIFHKILLSSGYLMTIEIYETVLPMRKKEGFTYLRGCNRFKGEIAID
jgi:hypothetical protein